MGSMAEALEEALAQVPASASKENIKALVREAWSDVVQAMPRVQRGSVLLLIADGKKLELSIMDRLALRKVLQRMTIVLASAIQALESEAGPGLVRLIVIAPEAVVALRVSRPGAMGLGGSA